MTYLGCPTPIKQRPKTKSDREGSHTLEFRKQKAKGLHPRKGKTEKREKEASLTVGYRALWNGQQRRGEHLPSIRNTNNKQEGDDLPEFIADWAGLLQYDFVLGKTSPKYITHDWAVKNTPPSPFGGSVALCT